MFYLHLHDVPPNTNYGEFVAAEYEAEAALHEAGEFHDAYANAADEAAQHAWNRMVSREA